MKFFAIFKEILRKFVYKSTIYTFVIWEKMETPTPGCTKVYFLLLCFGRKFDHPPPKWYFCAEKLTNLYKIV